MASYREVQSPQIAIYYRRGKHGEGGTVEESLVEKGTGGGNFDEKSTDKSKEQLRQLLNKQLTQECL